MNKYVKINLIDNNQIKEQKLIKFILSILPRFNNLIL